jgi:hypothetical protein
MSPQISSIGFKSGGMKEGAVHHVHSL